MPDQDRVKVKHMNGAVEITITPATGDEQSITIPSGAQARYVARHINTSAGEESEFEALFDAK